VVVGIPVEDQVYSLLRQTLSDGLASKFNWKGTREKLALSESSLAAVITGLCHILILNIQEMRWSSLVYLKDIFSLTVSGAMLDVHKTHDLSVADVDCAIKEWLKHAPKRWED